MSYFPNFELISELLLAFAKYLLTLLRTFKQRVCPSKN